MTNGGAELLVGIDGNAYHILTFVSRELRKRGFDQSYIAKYLEDAESDDYNHLLSASRKILDKTNPDSD